MKKLIKSLFLSCLSLTFVFALTSCFEETPGPNVGETPKEETKPMDKTPEVTKYIVGFDTAGGSNIESVEVEEGNKLSEPTPPTKNGYVFAGWYKEPMFTEEWDFSVDTVNDNLNLYAKWVANSYKVTFVIDEENSKTESLEYNSTIDFIPTKQHYDFKGWTLTEGSNQLLVDYRVPNKDITLYAKWEFVGSVGLDIHGTTLLGIGSCTDTDIIIPAYITNIGDAAFSYCTEITSITFEEGSQLTSIGQSAFDACSKLASIELPSTVTSIGHYAFGACSKLTSIEIPSTVTSIGEFAFYDCESLTSIEIPSGVTSLENYVFMECESLISIEIPSTVTNIGEYAFSGCSSLTSIKIPASVINMGNGAFVGCSSVTSIMVDENNTIYDSRDNCNAIILTSENKLIAGCQSTIIPNSVTIIANGAFSGCTNLISIEIPASVTGIAEGSFSGCDNLTSIKVDENNKSYDSRDNCNAIISWDQIIVGCKSTIIPNTVTSIGSDAFRDCKTLTNLEIPNSVTSIGMNAFSGCSGLTSIEIPASVESIGYSAFDRCTSLTSISIPAAVTKLETATFSYCTSLEKVSFVGDSKLTYIGDGVFSNCTSLTNIAIPTTVTTLGEYVFYECTSLTKITLSSTITKIGKSTFYNCTSLEDVLIGAKLTIIPRETFYGCTSLKSVAIPDTVTTIAGDAFRECKNLESILIPYSVKIVESNAFRGCTNLKNIYYTLYETEWVKVYVYDGGNTYFTSATVYYLSKEEPTISGNFWHYDDNGKPVLW